MVGPQPDGSYEELVKAMIGDLKEIRRINDDLAKRGPDTAAVICRNLCDKVLDAIRQIKP